MVPLTRPATAGRPNRQHRPGRCVRAHRHRRRDRRVELLHPRQRCRGHAARGHRLPRLDLADGSPTIESVIRAAGTTALRPAGERLRSDQSRRDRRAHRGRADGRRDRGSADRGEVALLEQVFRDGAVACSRAWSASSAIFDPAEEAVQEAFAVAAIDRLRRDHALAAKARLLDLPETAEDEMEERRFPTSGWS